MSAVAAEPRRRTSRSPNELRLASHLQVVDSKLLKSATHSVNRTAGRSPSVSRADSLVHVPQALKTVTRHFATLRYRWASRCGEQPRAIRQHDWDRLATVRPPLSAV